MAQIKSADTKGTGLIVDALGRATVVADSSPTDRRANENNRVWSIYFTVTPSATSYFFTLINTGEFDLNITDIRIASAAANTFNYRKVTGTPSVAGVVTPEITARNLGSVSQPNATIDVGTAITALTDAGTLFFEKTPTADKREKLTTTSNIIIPQGQRIAFFAQASNLVECLVSLVQVKSADNV